MKTTQQHVPVLLFMMLYKVVLSFKYLVKIVFNVTIQMEATGQYFQILCSILYYNRWFLLSPPWNAKRLFVWQFIESSELHRSYLVGVDWKLKQFFYYFQSVFRNSVSRSPTLASKTFNLQNSICR